MRFHNINLRQHYKGTKFHEKKIKFDKVSSVSVLKTLKEFKTNKATGVYNQVRRFLKDGSNTLYATIARICNLSIKLAFFPDK